MTLRRTAQRVRSGKVVAKRRRSSVTKTKRRIKRPVRIRRRTGGAFGTVLLDIVKLLDYMRK